MGKIELDRGEEQRKEWRREEGIMRVSDEGWAGGACLVPGLAAFSMRNSIRLERGERLGWRKGGIFFCTVSYVRYGGYSYSMEQAQIFFATMKQHVPTRLAKTRRARPDSVACEKRLR